tara:strand:+ start:1203 stop:1400 length:198 start_codon:yes stop_codon:yes gene_type:complete
MENERKIIQLLSEGVVDNIARKVAEEPYVLLVANGTYAEDSLIKLIWTIFKHRLHHLCNGEGWRD